MWSHIIQCIIAVAGIGFGIVWAVKNRNVPLVHIRKWLNLAVAAFCLLGAISLRVESEWLELFLLIFAWQIVPWCWIEVWRRIVNKEEQEPAK